MSGFLIGFFTVVLVLASLFMIFVVLLQRGSEGGSGAAFGGGAAESAFGGETNKVLTRATVITAIIFFVVGLGLYLGQIAAHKKPHSSVKLDALVEKAQSKADAQSKASEVEKPLKPGEETEKAMKILAAETKSGATAPIEVQPEAKTNAASKESSPAQSKAATTTATTLR